MATPTSYPDGLTPEVLRVIAAQVSEEIASSALVTSAVADGSARVRRNLRVVRRAVNGHAARYGVGLVQALSELRQDAPHLVEPLLALHSTAPVGSGVVRNGKRARRRAERAARVAATRSGRVA